MSNSADVGARATEDDPAGREGAEQGPHKTNQVALGAGIAVFLGMALFWAAIFSGAFTTRNPDKLHDATWAPAAERVCRPAATTINNLPNASTTKSADERADLIDLGTAALEPMVARLGAIPTPERASDRTVGDRVPQGLAHLPAGSSELLRGPPQGPQGEAAVDRDARRLGHRRHRRDGQGERHPRLRHTRRHVKFTPPTDRPPSGEGAPRPSDTCRDDVTR